MASRSLATYEQALKLNPFLNEDRPQKMNRVYTVVKILLGRISRIISSVPLLKSYINVLSRVCNDDYSQGRGHHKGRNRQDCAEFPHMNFDNIFLDTLKTG